MKAFQIVARGAPLAEAELAEPDPGVGEVVVSIQAAGICRSDVHYKSGTRPVPSLPLVPGHEIAGTVQAIGDEVETHQIGDRVCLHYLVTCAECGPCRRGAEQFCRSGQMIGLDRQGGYAEAITIPARNAHHIPDGVSTEAAAVMMCSTATSLHALRRGRVGPGSKVAVFGSGGLGMSAIQLALALEVDAVFAIDINPVKLEAAEELGAIPIDGSGDVAAAVRAASAGGVDIALELVGSAPLMAEVIASLAPGGRAVAVGITDGEFGLDPYRDLIRTEVEIIGSADHLATEIDEILTWAQRGIIDIDRLITQRVPFELAQVNAALDRLEGFGDEIRSVITPE
ncbi:MAG: zinc-binding dehydrogenase [Acidobacteria bacterium]|nr:zinc-binding dehydrogenase [Acidobacteriota bacterium]